MTKDVRRFLEDGSEGEEKKEWPRSGGGGKGVGRILITLE